MFYIRNHLQNYFRFIFIGILCYSSLIKAAPIESFAQSTDENKKLEQAYYTEHLHKCEPGVYKFNATSIYDKHNTNIIYGFTGNQCLVAESFYIIDVIDKSPSMFYTKICKFKKEDLALLDPTKLSSKASDEFFIAADAACSQYIGRVWEPSFTDISNYLMFNNKRN